MNTVCFYSLEFNGFISNGFYLVTLEKLVFVEGHDNFSDYLKVLSSIIVFFSFRRFLSSVVSNKHS